MTKILIKNSKKIMINKILTIAALLILVLIASGCSTPWAPVPEGERANRLKFYDTEHWPYARELPPIKVPAQVVAGLPSLPAIFVMTPFTLFLSDEPTYDFGMAVIEAERLYMEYPGYAIYRAVGYPMYILKEGAVVSGEYIYDSFSSDDVVETAENTVIVETPGYAEESLKDQEDAPMTDNAAASAAGQK